MEGGGGGGGGISSGHGILRCLLTLKSLNFGLICHFLVYQMHFDNVLI